MGVGQPEAGDQAERRVRRALVEGPERGGTKAERLPGVAVIEHQEITKLGFGVGRFPIGWTERFLV